MQATVMTGIGEADDRCAFVMSEQLTIVADWNERRSYDSLS